MPTESFLSDVIAAGEAFGELTAGESRTTYILEVTSVTPQGAGVVVRGRHVSLDQVLDIGTFFQRPLDALDPDFAVPMRDIYRPPFGSNVLSAFHEQETGRPPDFKPPPLPTPREAKRLLLQGHRSLRFSLGSVHFPINDVEIARGIRLDGELLLDALNVEIKVRMRGLVPARITLKLATKAEPTLRLSAGAGSGNRTRPLVEQEKEFPAIPLPEIVFNLGPVPIEITPLFKTRVGVVPDAPCRRDPSIRFRAARRAGRERLGSARATRRRCIPSSRRKPTVRGRYSTSGRFSRRGRVKRMSSAVSRGRIS